MNLTKKIYAKYLQVFRREIDRSVKKNITIETYKSSALNDKHSIITAEPREQKIIISFTTFGKRIDSVYLTIESIARQTLKPDVVILWLAENEFNKNTIPIHLQKFENRGLTISYCKDIRSYKKLIPTLQKYPDDIIITIDDDIIYPITLVEKLIQNHKNYPDSICCNRARKIILDKNNNPTPYNSWPQAYQSVSPSFELIPIGVGGVLYFPGCFNTDIIKEELFTKLAPTADDLWFKILAQKKGTKTMVFNDLDHSDYIPLGSSNFNSLAEQNVGNNMNDVQLRALLNYYDIKLNKAPSKPQ